MTTGRATITYEPPDLIQRMQRYPTTLNLELEKTHAEALKVLHGNVPPYAQKPAGSKYVRTGQLGAGLGSSQSGGASGGQPSIYKTRRLGSGAYISEIGSNRPHYNAAVIGEGRQAPVHSGRWWTEITWLKNTMSQLIKVFDKSTERMAKFLDGKA